MDDDINVTVIQPYGAIEVATMHNGVRVSQRYYEYTKAEALADFKTRLNTRHDA